MTKYEIIFESLQSQLDQGLISEELADEVNDLAYDLYANESTAAAKHGVPDTSDAHKSGKKAAEYYAKSKKLKNKSDEMYTKGIHGDTQSTIRGEDYRKRAKNLDKLARECRTDGCESKIDYKLKNRAIDLDSRTGIKPGKSTEEKKDMIKNNLEIAGVKNMDGLRRRAKENSEYLKNTPVRNRKNSIEDRMAKPEKSMAKKKRIAAIKDEIRQSTKRGLQQTKNAFTPHKKLTYKGF